MSSLYQRRGAGRNEAELPAGNPKTKLASSEHRRVAGRQLFEDDGSGCASALLRAPLLCYVVVPISYRCSLQN